MTKYLQELDIPISKDLATALLYGIRTDTLGFKRNANRILSQTMTSWTGSKRRPSPQKRWTCLGRR